MPSRAPDRERLAVGTEGERVQGSDCCSHEAELIAARQRFPQPTQRLRVEEDDPAVVTADGKRAAIGAKRLVQQTVAALVRNSDRGGAAQQRGKQVAAGGDGVVEVDALPCEQQRSVDARVDQRLCAEALSDRRGRLAPCGPSRHERQPTCNEGGDKHEDGSREQAAQSPVRASERAAALLQEVVLEPVQSCVVTGSVGPVERASEASPAVELARIARRRLPLRCRLSEVPVQAAALSVLLQPVDEPRPLVEQRLVHELDLPVVGDEQPALDQRREHMLDALVVIGIELAARHAAAREGVALAGNEPEQYPARDLLLLLA